MNLQCQQSTTTRAKITANTLVASESRQPSAGHRKDSTRWLVADSKVQSRSRKGNSGGCVSGIPTSRAAANVNASWLVQAGADPKSAQSQMWHSAFRPRWTFTHRSFRRHKGEQSTSCRNLQKIHRPLRSNKAGNSLTKSGSVSRQVIERFGGASRDRTDGLVVANDALSQLSYSPTLRSNESRYKRF